MALPGVRGGVGEVEGVSSHAQMPLGVNRVTWGGMGGSEEVRS